MRIFKTISEYLDAMQVQHNGVNDLIYVFRIEEHVEGMIKEMGPHRKQFFQVTFGRGHNMKININDDCYNPINSTLSFSTPYHTKSWKVYHLQSDAVCYMVLFHPKLLQANYKWVDPFKQYSFFNINTSPTISLPKPLELEIEQLMATILKEYKQLESNSSLSILSAYLSIILEKTNSCFHQPNANIIFKNRSEEIAFQFENLLKNEINHQRHLSDYAQMLNISSTYLSEAVKKATGKSAKSVATEAMILQAKTLLTQKDDTISNIADTLGFSDNSNFVKFFKQHSGQTPNQYRKSN